MMKKSLFAAIAALALAIAALIAPPQQHAGAAVTNVPVASPTPFLIPIHLSGSYTTTTTAAKFNMPMPCDMIGVGATARAAGSALNTIDVQLGGTTILSAALALSTGNYQEATISTAAITDEGVITVIVNTPLGNAAVTDTMVLLTCARK